MQKADVGPSKKLSISRAVFEFDVCMKKKLLGELENESKNTS